MRFIRQAIEADAPHLPSIERSAGQAFLRIPELSWIADDDVLTEDRHRELIRGGATWVAVEPSSPPIGFISGEITKTNLHIWALAVRFDRQGEGLGRELLETARRSAVHAKLASMTLTTFRDVPWNAPFYQSLGFEILPPLQTPPFLSALLDAEVAAGLPADRRCAMQLSLSPT
ncbi:GNAT family N-acetyltransferase [Myxococcus sp. Y35]|uniref:GNAT family N-acetyltransferase n=1 Tax=Pseudomyxococcus flavus TaxID=3115648 RepID=UPI003CF739C2